MRRPWLRTASAVAAVAGLAFAAAGCASNRDNQGATTKDTLVFGVAGDAKVLDPAFAQDGESLRVARQIFETLVQPEEGGANIVPGLAESYSSDPTGTVWTFNLKQGVKFQDGTDFNADAVCFNFDRWYNFTGLLQNGDVSYYWQAVFGGFAKNESPDLGESLFKSCTAKDDHTVEIAITHATSKFPAALALASFSISSPAALKKYHADDLGGSADSIQYPEYATAHPVGTGPYMLDSWDTTNKVVKLTRFDGYHGEKAKIKNLQFKTISDESARKQALEAGDIQGYDLVGPADVKPLKDEGFNVLTRPAFNVLYLAMNQSGNPALKDVRVRQAIAYAINRQGIVDAQYPAGSTVAHNFMPPSLPGYNDQAMKYDYNPEKAKQLLADAGYANGLKLTFYYPTEVTRPYMPAPKDIFELMAADLKAVGIAVEPHAEKWNPDYLNSVLSTKNHDLHLLGWTGDYADAYNFIGTFFNRPTDEWGFNNPEIFNMLKQADSTADVNARNELYKQINAKLMEFLPGVPIAHAPPSLVFAKDVTGVKPSPLTDERFYTAEFVTP